MTIQSLNHEDLLDVTMRKGSHVFFDVPFEGGAAAMEYQAEHEGGYGFLAWLDEEHPQFDVSLIPPHKEWDLRTAQEQVGDQWTWEDEGAGITWHAVYTHSVEYGYYPGWYAEEQRGQGIELMIDKLDEWWAENEEDIPLHSVYTTLWGFGTNHSRVGDFRSQTKLWLKVLADSEVEFQVYWVD